MITQNHDSKYDFLYKEAIRVLHENNKAEGIEEIQSIDEYFNYLQDLATLEESNPNIDPIFTMIPATENTFVIDANTRAITAPPEFGNGVGVQGDDIAEIIYFEIDRYFDAVDLATMKILIQWCRAGKEKSTLPGDQHLAATYKKSLTLKQGKIIFGWPITAEMTEEAGDIVYSVRFYKEIAQDGKVSGLQYSFGTSPSKIKIKQGLNFEISDSSLIELANSDMSKRIYNNLRGPIQLPNAVQVAEPYIEYYKYIIGDNEVIMDADSDTKTLIHDLEDGLQFAVKACVTKDLITTGVHHRKDDLVYAWIREPEVNEDITDAFEFDINYTPVNSAAYNEYEIYYENVENEFVDANIENQSDFNNKQADLYVRESVCEPKMAGHYKCKITNVYNTASFSEIISDTWTVPFPQQPEFGSFEQKQQFGGAGETSALNANIVASGDDIQTYQWKMKSGEDFIDIQDATDITYIPAQEGEYRVQVTNNRNNYNKTNISNIITAVHAPIVPNVSGYKLAETIVSNNIAFGSQGDELKVVVDNINNQQYVGDITYNWYFSANASDAEALLESNSDAISLTSEGYYRCVVINTYKDFSTESTNTDKVFIKFS